VHLGNICIVDRKFAQLKREKNYLTKPLTLFEVVKIGMPHSKNKGRQFCTIGLATIGERKQNAEHSKKLSQGWKLDSCLSEGDQYLKNHLHK
jgi:hypothetical protein